MCCTYRYQESDRFGKLGYEDEFLHYLEKIVRDLDRRIERGRERLQKSVSAKQKVCPLEVDMPWCGGDVITLPSLLKVLQGESGINSDKLKALNDEINLRVAEVTQSSCSYSLSLLHVIVGQLDHLGTQGQVEEAQQLMKRVEELEKEREKERMHLVNMTHKVSWSWICCVSRNSRLKNSRACDESIAVRITTGRSIGYFVFAVSRCYVFGDDLQTILLEVTVLPMRIGKFENLKI